MKGRSQHPSRNVWQHLRKRQVLVGLLVLVAAAVPATTRAVQSHGALIGLERAPGPGRAAPGGGGVPVTQPTAGTAHRDELKQGGQISKPRELRLTKARGAVFDVRTLKSTVVKRERPEHADPIHPEREMPARVAPSAMKRVQTAAAAPGPDSNFAGLDFANWGQGHPPDTNGDVGPNYYIETINVSIGIYDKSNGNRVAAFTFNSFMSQGQFGNLCDTDNFGDPVVLYDSFENRWVITDFAFKLDASGNVNPQHVFQCFAVSKTGDPVAGGWNFYSIEAPGGIDDYPKFGVWPDGIYMSANMFGYASGASFSGTHVWAINKQQMYAGEPTAQIADFATPNAGDFTLLPANARLQAGTPPV